MQQEGGTSGFSAAQIEFLAEEEMVTIVPSTRLPVLEFISV